MATDDLLQILRRVTGGVLALLGLVWFVAMMTTHPDYRSGDSLGPGGESRDLVVSCQAIDEVGAGNNGTQVEVASGGERVGMDEYLRQHLTAGTDDTTTVRLGIESRCAENRDRNLMFAMVAVLVFAGGLAVLVAQGRTSRERRFGASYAGP